MNKLDALWQYQQAELEADKLENKLKSTPARQKLNKLFNFLKEQHITGNQFAQGNRHIIVVCYIDHDLVDSIIQIVVVGIFRTDFIQFVPDKILVGKAVVM